LLQAVAASTSGLTVGVSILITIAGALIAQFLRTGTTTKDLVEINKQLLESDEKLALAFQRMAQASGITTGEISKQAAAYRNLLQVDLQTSLTNVATALKDVEVKTTALNKAEQQQKADLAELANLQKILSGAANAQGQDLGRLQTRYEGLQITTETYKSRQLELNQARQEAENGLKPHIESLIRAGEATHKTAEEILGMARAAGVSAPSIARLRVEMSAAARDANDLANALALIKPPAFDVSGTRKALQNAAETARRGIEAASPPRQSALGLDQGERVATNKKNLEEVNQRLQDYARYQAQGATATARNTDAQRIYREELAKLDPAVRAQVESQVKAADVSFATATAHRSGAGAARAYANALVELTKRAQDAEAALISDNFAVRDQKIANDIVAERAHLQINKRDKEAALIALARIETAQREKVNQDRLEAEQRVLRDIRRLAISADEDERRRRQIELRIKLQEVEEQLFKEFGVTQRAQVLIDALQRVLVNNFNDWDLKQTQERAVKGRQIREEEERKFYENQRKIEFAARSNRAGRAQVEAEALARESRLKDLRQRFAGQFGGGAQSDQLDRIDKKLLELGLTVQDVAGRLGYAAQNADAFERGLSAIQRIEQGGFGNILAGSLQLIFDKFQLAMIVAESFANALQQAFIQSIAYGKNFVEVFGKTLLAGILSAIGQHAIAEGTYHILAGTAKLFNPFTAAAGAQEIAAGTALVAFGSALVGAATAISNSLNRNSGGATQQAARGNGASSGSASTPANNNQPTVLKLPVPTSGKDSGTIIKLDAKGTENFMRNLFEKHEVVTPENMGRKLRSKLQPIVKNLATA